ncbi:phosphoribosylanthranilate isomerase [Fredinandcohnia quinoae]|uniref:N-(5'-phosphoribosyl)anthranilate isomerase n=1 Tax=Fredinandcohnia quinoae TaxID=2918902 RepID=A0AAW5DWM0_9BACI|nr:phosphoribosylanthranilate isomerase [Fredinandcohnia sp. SECRCQ15]MCH1624743.1 phosphoribosylanthranilate isomerase [Fredinandcohnia sp. SECRCQ15]
MKQVRSKYCGNQSFEDLKVSASSNADYIGFIFAPSKRRVEPVEVRKWIQNVDLKNKKLVGIFVHATLGEIKKVLSLVPLSIIQCHGNESVEDIMKIKHHTHLHVWKAIHHEIGAIDIMNKFAGVIDGYVIDTKVQDVWGGSGIAFDWSYIPSYMAVARRQGVACLVAGGINVDNIQTLLNYDIGGIDLASGIESNGKKDIERIRIIEKWVKRYEDSRL